MKKIVIFPFNYKNKTEYLIRGYFDVNPLKTLYMAPHISKIRDFKIKYHISHPSSILPATHSLKTLALKIVDEFSSSRIISEVEKYIIILTLLKEKKTGILFKQNLSGVALAILHFIKDIKISSESDVDYRTIEQGIANYNWKFGYNLNVLMEAVDIIKEYDRFLKKEKLIDMEDIYKESSTFIDKVPWNNLVLEGFYEIPPYQKSFVKALIQQIEDICFSFCYDEKISSDVKDLILDKTLLFLKNVCSWQEIRLNNQNVTSKVECYNFSSPPEEIKGMVRLISRYLKDNPQASFNDVMVVFPSMPAYRAVVQRIFGRYKIPCEIIPGYSLAHDSSISELLAFYSFRDTYDWEVLMSLLMSPHFRAIKHEKSEEFSVFSRKEFEHTGFFKDNFFALSDSNITLIKSLLKETAGEAKSCEEWIKDVYKVIEILGWQPGIPEVRYSFEMVLESLKTSTIFSLEEFLGVLMKSFELIDIQQGRGVGIKVSGVLESVGIEKKLCFIGGATEDNIPQAPSVEEIFIPDRLKNELGFTDYNLRMARERFDIYRLKSENERVVFTYPSKVAGKNQMKSIFLFGQEESVLEEDCFTTLPKAIYHFNFSQEKFRQKFVSDGKLKITVTQLEMLLKCPYRFYLEKVEGVSVYNRPEIDEAMDLWGTIIHSVMQKIFEKYKGRFLSEEHKEEIEKNFNNNLMTEIDGLCTKGLISYFYRDVMKIRTQEVANKFNEIIVKHLGVEIVGLEEDITIQLPSLVLKGKIDRIEKTSSGHLTVIDIKTGTSKPPSYTEKDFFNKANLQLPVYIWMYMKKYSRQLMSMSGSIWRFHFKEEDSSKSEIVYRSSNLTYLDRLEDYLDQTAQNLMNRTDFAPEKPEGCFSCPYKGMCPYEKT